jgi:ubiquinone/menaquinone biosynthesis C-methylase UbiE
MMTTEVTNRFSDRVQNYVKYRPNYPEEMVTLLLNEKIISPACTIADIGSGTGISSELFLKNGFNVIGVEPNEAMRLAAEQILNSYLEKKQFISVNASAEKTTLQENSVDAVICAQAFHWFNQEEFKKECQRILKPSGQVILVWNDRRTDTNDFLKVYEDFLQMFAIDYKQVNHKNVQDKTVFNKFFGKECREFTLFNYQDVDLEGLKGRVLSSSYMPNEGHKDFDHMMYVLRKIFQRYQENGIVRLEYDTKIYTGTLN